MGGWITKTTTKDVHSDDCASNKYGQVCAAYKNSALYSCPGHRSMDESRNGKFESYGPGDIVDHDQPVSLRSQLKAEIAARRAHVFYKNELSALSPLPGSDPISGDLVAHGQENVINNCISALNSAINKSRNNLSAGSLPDGDWGISKKEIPSTVHGHAVPAGAVLSAENLLYLERNTLSALRDCICYADCTSHGKKTTTTRTWCAAYGAGGLY